MIFQDTPVYSSTFQACAKPVDKTCMPLTEDQRFSQHLTAAKPLNLSSEFRSLVVFHL